MQERIPRDLENHPSRVPAQIAYLKGVEALAKDPDRAGEAHWLRRQDVAAINQEGWILVLQGNETEARLANANEAMVRLGHMLRAKGLAKGVYNVARPAPQARPGEASKRGQRAAGRAPWDRPVVFMPAFLVATTLPHRKPPGTEFSRANGKVQTTLVSTKRAGLPFGIYPRLIVIYLATTAKRTGIRRLMVARSINELLGQMGIADSGGKAGPATLARDQLDRLCTTTFVTTHNSKYGGHKLDVADKWLEKTHGGLEVELSERFYDQATKSAVPLDPVILRAVRRSPLSIDAYGWLTYRMNTLQEPTAITWPQLQNQFGSEYRNARQFRWRFRQAVERVKAVWHGELGIEIQERRVILTPGPPSVTSRHERSNAKGH